MNNEINIRKTEIFDLPYIYNICLKTGDAGKDASSLYGDPCLLGHYYAAPYLIYSDSICFTADFNNRPSGYIIGVADTIDFNKWMEDVWLPPLRNFYKLLPNEFIKTDKEKNLITEIYNPAFPIDEEDFEIFKEYPAHLHIDILPVLQGKGLGRSLTERFFSELKDRGVTGVHLGVSNENKGAISFYKKLDFTVRKEHDWGFTMVKLCK